MVGALVCGFFVSLATGIIENPPQASIIGARYYGFPLVWRVTLTLQPDELRLAIFAIDTLIWIAISFVAMVIIVEFPRNLRAKD